MCLTQRKAALHYCVSCKSRGLEPWPVRRKEVLGHHMWVSVVLIFHHPWKPGDLVMWLNQIPRLREDAGQCASLFHIICSRYDPSWASAGLLLKEPFHPQEQDKTIEKNMWSWPTGKGKLGCLASDWSWLGLLQSERDNSQSVIRACEETSKLN